MIIRGGIKVSPLLLIYIFSGIILLLIMSIILVFINLFIDRKILKKGTECTAEVQKIFYINSSWAFMYYPLKVKITTPKGEKIIKTYRRYLENEAINLLKKQTVNIKQYKNKIVITEELNNEIKTISLRDKYKIQ